MGEHDLVDLLPEVIRVSAVPGSPLDALGAVAVDMHAPVVRVLDRIDDVVDPFRTPEPLVPYLAGWVGLDWLTTAEGGNASRPMLGIGSGRLRDLIAASADLSARRGTPAGLARFLHLATGVDGFDVEDVPGAFHVRVTVPPAVADRAGLVARLVQALKPVHVTSEIVLRAGADARGAEDRGNEDWGDEMGDGRTEGMS